MAAHSDPDPRGSDPAFMMRRARARRATVPLPTLLRWGRDEITRAGLSAAEAEWLLEWATGADSLVTAPQEVGIRAAEAYRSGIAQRRSRIPLQHIMGEMSFRYLTLKAGPGVFSVRPETETLVELALKQLREAPVFSDGKQHVADLCAGSGAVGLSIAKEAENVNVDLVELDPMAAAYLYANVEGCAPYAAGSTAAGRVEDAVVALQGKEGTMALVASNPPYVRRADIPTQPEAQADPEVALYGGGEDGLVIPRGVVGRAFDLLAPGGSLVLEHGETQGEALAAHALTVGFSSAETAFDLTDRPRFLVARKADGAPNPK